MELDFKTPQRQSVTGIIIMFADTFQGLIRALWAPILVVLFRMKSENYLLIALGFLALVVLTLVIGYLKYRNFTFFLDEEKQEFVLSKGIINKSKINIQLSKIQQVNINQSIIQKIIGVYSLDIDTAGSDKKEISIRAIDQSLALILKERLLDYGDKEEAVSEEKSEIISNTSFNTKPFIKISYATLFKVGITSNYGRTIALLITFAITLYQSFKDAISTFEIDETTVDSAFEKSAGYFSAGILVVGLLFLVLLINIIRTFIKHFDFEMIKQKQSLAITSGLFAKKNTLLNPDKVQITSYSQNYFQKKLKILDMNMKQASSNEAKEEQKKSNVIEVPGCNSYERDEILKLILGKIPEKRTPIQPNFRYLISRIFSVAVFLGIIFTVLNFSEVENITFYIPLIFVYLGLVSSVIYFGFKNNRLYSNENFVILKHGAWDVEHEIIEPYKIQAITTRQYFWHKRADVGHLTLHTAAGDVHFKFGDFTKIKQLVNYWLYQVETSKQNWM
ncbi:putative membrane protein [Flavobacterium gossypii]|uniref:Membrane protein n=1 Tax=Flavobacterium gossypii TaxID=1646119 RepID=A0ABR6DQR0_9FLAO|nr:PH domain-containing protein [Flavobacterium gossypii]MBA9074027.1 putative membrane protein [Flavobacterium gossypii]